MIAPAIPLAIEAAVLRRQSCVGLRLWAAPVVKMVCLCRPSDPGDEGSATRPAARFLLPGFAAARRGLAAPSDNVTAPERQLCWVIRSAAGRGALVLADPVHWAGFASGADRRDH